MENHHQEALTKFGFKFGKNGAHSARSMMSEELRILFLATTPEMSKEQYQTEIIEHNLTKGKPPALLG